MNTLLSILALLAIVYTLMVGIAYFIGHPTPLRWWRPDMHPDDDDQPW